MKISGYPSVDTFDLSDLTVISGVSGDRQIQLEKFLLHKPKGPAGHALVTLVPANWQDNLTQTVVLPSAFGMHGATVFLWDLAKTTNTEQFSRFSRAGIRDVGQGTNYVTFKAFFFKPDMPIEFDLWNLGGNPT